MLKQWHTIFSSLKKVTLDTHKSEPYFSILYLQSYLQNLLCVTILYLMVDQSEFRHIFSLTLTVTNTGVLSHIMLLDTSLCGCVYQASCSACLHRISDTVKHAIQITLHDLICNATWAQHQLGGMHGKHANICHIYIQWRVSMKFLFAISWNVCVRVSA